MSRGGKANRSEARQGEARHLVGVQNPAIKFLAKPLRLLESLRNLAKSHLRGIAHLPGFFIT
jgi:hypothetical protein